MKLVRYCANKLTKYLAMAVVTAVCTVCGASAAVASSVTLSLVATDTDSYVTATDNRRSGLEFPSDMAEATTVSALFDESKMMRVRDLRPGMKGYGLTVFSGIRPEKFGIEIVGVIHRAFSGDDLILVMCDSPYLKDIGVVAGMSGSPVYIDDKLVGAIGYGWGFTDVPLGGVTPIESMLQVMEITEKTPAGGGSGEDTAGGDGVYERYWEMRERLQPGAIMRAGGSPSMALDAALLPDAVREHLGGADTFRMEPLATPIFLSTANPATLRFAEQMFAGSGVRVMSSALGAGSGVESGDSESAPGGPVTDLDALAAEVSGGYGLAVPFVEGDLAMAGVGTVTYRSGETLIAFGHPMFFHGVTNYPMAPARINTFVRSKMRPFKLGQSVGQVGTVVQDRLPAIGGRFGPKPKMFDVAVSVVDERYLGRRDYRYRIWNDRNNGPMFASMVIVDAVGTGSRAGGETAEVTEYTVTFDDGTTISRELYFGDMYMSGYGAYYAGSDVGILMNNPYKKVSPVSIDFRSRVMSRLEQATLRTATTDLASYRPGDTVLVTVELQPNRRPIETATYEFRLPDTIADGDYELVVADSLTRSQMDYMLSPARLRVMDYESLLRALQVNYPRNKAYVTLRDRDTGVAVRGQEMPKLPASIIATLGAATDRTDFAPMTGNLLVDAEIGTNYDITGSQFVNVRVARRP